VLKDPAVNRRFEEVDLNIWGGPPERLANLIKTETARWGKLVRERDIKAE